MAREVSPGVYEVPVRIAGIPYVNAFLIADDELTLIDTGLPKRAHVILAAVVAAKRRASDLRHIVITHHHADHAGNLSAVAAATGAHVYAHPLDAPIVRGDRPAPGPTKSDPLTRLVEWIGERTGLGRFDPAAVDAELADGQELPFGGGLHVLHTPGHTAGHISLLLPSRRLLFAGDAAGALFGRVGTPLGAYTEDMDEAKRSIRRLAELDFDVACFGHGRSIRSGATTAFRRLVERLAGDH